MEEICIISSSNGETFNERILSYSEKYKIKKEKNKERISQWRENQNDDKNVTRYEHDGNAPKVKLSKVKVYRESTHTHPFTKPTISELAGFLTDLLSKNEGAAAEISSKFFDYYESNGWRVGRNPMKDWKAAARNWVKNENLFKNGTHQQSTKRGKSAGASAFLDESKEFVRTVRGSNP